MGPNHKVGKLYQGTSLRNGGRKAGAGVCYDDYSEDALGGGIRSGTVNVRFCTNNIKPEDLNGPVICYKGTPKEG